MIDNAKGVYIYIHQNKNYNAILILRMQLNNWLDSKFAS